MEKELLLKVSMDYSFETLKKLQDMQYKKYKRRTNIYVILVSLLAILFFTFNLLVPQADTMTFGIIMALLAVSVFLISKKRYNNYTVMKNTSIIRSERETTVEFYNDSFHYSSVWENGKSIFTVDYNDVTRIVQNDEIVMIAYDRNTVQIHLNKMLIDNDALQLVLTEINKRLTIKNQNH